MANTEFAFSYRIVLLHYSFENESTISFEAICNNTNSLLSHLTLLQDDF